MVQCGKLLNNDFHPSVQLKPKKKRYKLLNQYKKVLVLVFFVDHLFYRTVEDAQAYFNLESYMVQSDVGALMMGIVTSAIVAVFVRSKSKG